MDQLSVLGSVSARPPNDQWSKKLCPKSVTNETVVPRNEISELSVEIYSVHFSDIEFILVTAFQGSPLNNECVVGQSIRWQSGFNLQICRQDRFIEINEWTEDDQSSLVNSI